jgi:EAL domain-containing protein (putative c-di-GMP-specific phosphodiesterase class I)
MRITHAPAAAVTVTEVLRNRLITPLFQPIVDLSTRVPVGVEALARGPAGAELEFPDRLFAAARADGLLPELDILCFERALECALTSSAPPPLLFVNAEPAVLDQPVSPRIIDMVAKGLPFRYILEYTERALPTSPGVLVHLAGLVQLFGHGIALDDVGVDPMSLAFLPVLEPEVIKLDMSLLRDPQSAHTRAVRAVVGAEARRTGALVVAEGIETEDDLITARTLGAHWGQGWLFARPAPIDQVAHRFEPGAVGRLRAPRPGFHRPEGSPFEVAAGHGPVVEGAEVAIAAGVARLRDMVASDPNTVVVISSPATGVPGVTASWDELIGRTRSAILLDEPVPGEFAVTVIGPGYGSALCADSTGRTVFLSHLPAVAEVTRVLLNRLGPGSLHRLVHQP